MLYSQPEHSLKWCWCSVFVFVTFCIFSSFSVITHRATSRAELRLERLNSVETCFRTVHKPLSLHRSPKSRFFTSASVSQRSKRLSRLQSTSRSRIIAPCRIIVLVGDFGSEIQIAPLCWRFTSVLAPKNKSYTFHDPTPAVYRISAVKRIGCISTRIITETYSVTNPNGLLPACPINVYI